MDTKKPEEKAPWYENLGLFIIDHPLWTVAVLLLVPLLFSVMVFMNMELAEEMLKKMP
jgi:hypothetical protein